MYYFPLNTALGTFSQHLHLYIPPVAALLTVVSTSCLLKTSCPGGYDPFLTSSNIASQKSFYRTNWQNLELPDQRLAINLLSRKANLTQADSAHSAHLPSSLPTLSLVRNLPPTRESKITCFSFVEFSQCCNWKPRSCTP